MHVILAKSSGFCFGVKRAMDMALAIGKTSGAEKPVYTDGPLIHNLQALDLLSERGIEPLGEIKESSNGTIIIRSHGITPQRRRRLEQSGAKVIDATCPRVHKVQSIIQDYTQKGYFIIIVGDAHHAEVAGLLGYASNKGVAIQSEDDLPNLPSDTKICLVAQTTQNREGYLLLAERIKERFPWVEVFDTICDANRQRQEELVELCPHVDAVVVVGGRHSGNTRRLFDIARATGTPAFFVETAADLDLEKLGAFQTVGVIGGASTPAWVLEEIVKSLEEVG